MVRLILAIWLGKIIYFTTRFFKSGGGSAAPGHYTLKIEPELIQKLASQIPKHTVITGTNGKTTTARILNHLLKNQEIKTLRNSTGSNLERGVASTLIKKAGLFGKITNIDLGVWELDEAAFNKVVFQIKPQIIVFLNAFRDQLDRYGEVDTVVNKWKESLQKIDWHPKIIINGSDENVTRLSSVKNLDSAIFKVEGKSFGEKNISAKKPLKADFAASNIKTHGLDGTSFFVSFHSQSSIFNLPVPGIYHIFDFLAAFAVYYNLNLPTTAINESLKNYSPAFGRVEKLRIGPNEAYIFLIKNPAGASLVFETISPHLKTQNCLLIALNDNFADGKDVSWIWDADFEQLTTNNFQLTIICSGKRAYDLVMRLKYAGFKSSQLLVEENLEQALDRSLSNLKGTLFILPTYTALLSLQKILTKKGHKHHYWKEEE